MGKPNEVNLLNFIVAFKNHCKNKEAVLLHARMTELDCDNLMKDLESLDDMIDPECLLDWLTENISTFDVDDLHEFTRIFITHLTATGNLKLDEINDMLTSSDDGFKVVKLYKFSELSDEVQDKVAKYRKYLNKITIKQAREWCVDNEDDFRYTASGALVNEQD